MTTKVLIAEQLMGKQFDGNNYEDWSCVMRNLLDEDDILHTLNAVQEEPIIVENENLREYRVAINDYNKWHKQNHSVHNILISIMHKELIPTYEVHETAKGIWDALTNAYAQKSDAEDVTRVPEIQDAG